MDTNCAYLHEISWHDYGSRTLVLRWAMMKRAWQCRINNRPDMGRSFCYTERGGCKRGIESVVVVYRERWFSTEQEEATRVFTQLWMDRYTCLCTERALYVKAIKQHRKVGYCRRAQHAAMLILRVSCCYRAPSTERRTSMTYNQGIIIRKTIVTPIVFLLCIHLTAVRSRRSLKEHARLRASRWQS